MNTLEIANKLVELCKQGKESRGQGALRCCHRSLAP